MDIITLDFETYYAKDYSLSRQGMTTQKYIDDPRFQTIGVGIKVNDDTNPIWVTGGKVKEELDKLPWYNAFLVCHNALFDASILAWRYDIYPKVICDTLSMARAYLELDAALSLEKLAQYFKLGIKGRAVHTAIGKRLEDFTLEELATYGEYCVNDVELTYALFKLLLPKFNKIELQLIDMTIKMHTNPQFSLDKRLLLEHLENERKRKQDLMAACNVTESSLLSNNNFAKLLEAFGVIPPRKISPQTGKSTYAFAKTDSGFIELLEHEDERVRLLAEARVGVKSTLEERRTERYQAIADAVGDLPVPLKYYGARVTGRWSATDGVQLQNIPRRSKLKDAIIAPMGSKIVGADLSNIELRVGLCFAGQYDAVKQLAEGRDLYKEFASNVFNVGYDDVNSEQRFIGKTSVLSLIYGVGANKLHRAIMLGLDKDTGKDKADEALQFMLAETIVSLYRKLNNKVVLAWRDAGEALWAMLYDEANVIGLGELRLDVRGYYGIELPSGLYMNYPNIEQVKGEAGKPQWQYKTKRRVAKIYPAKVFQNITQALARCVMGEAMVRINKKYPIALTVHDSCYAVVPEAKADEALRFMIAELRKPPSWMPKLPLDAEGGYGDNLAFKMGKVL